MSCIQHCPIIYIEFNYGLNQLPVDGPHLSKTSIFQFQNFISNQKVHLDLSIVGERQTWFSLWIFLWYSSEIKKIKIFNQCSSVNYRNFRTQQVELTSYKLKQLFKPWFFHCRCEWNHRIARVDWCSLTKIRVHHSPKRRCVMLEYLVTPAKWIQNQQTCPKQATLKIHFFLIFPTSDF